MRMLRRLGLLSLALGLTVAACDDDDETGPTSQVFTATLNGANERPQPVTTTATGTMTMTVPNNTPNQMAWTLNITSIPTNDTLTLSHIHKGVADSAGAIVVNFNPPFPLTGASVTLSGSVAVHDSVFTLIAGNRAYVNVHSKRAPGGVIRGQIVRQP